MKIFSAFCSENHLSSRAHSPILYILAHGNLFIQDIASGYALESVHYPNKINSCGYVYYKYINKIDRSVKESDAKGTAKLSTLCHRHEVFEYRFDIHKGNYVVASLIMQNNKQWDKSP